MGIFDRFVRKVEQNNSAAVFEAELARLDQRIVEHRSRVVELKAQAAQRARAADGSDAGYAELVEQAERLLVQLREQRRALDLERIAGPAAQAVAEARVAVDGETSGLGDSATASALASVRDDVESLKQRASGGLIDANGVPIHGRQAALDRKARDARAREELERMKRELLGDD